MYFYTLMPILCMYIRHKTNRDGRKYYYVVETVFTRGKPRQKIVRYLGTAEKILAVFEEAEKWRSKKTR